MCVHWRACVSVDVCLFMSVRGLPVSGPISPLPCKNISLLQQKKPINCTIRTEFNCCPPYSPCWSGFLAALQLIWYNNAPQKCPRTFFRWQKNYQWCHMRRWMSTPTWLIYEILKQWITGTTQNLMMIGVIITSAPLVLANDSILKLLYSILERLNAFCTSFVCAGWSRQPHWYIFSIFGKGVDLFKGYCVIVSGHVMGLNIFTLELSHALKVEYYSI